MKTTAPEAPASQTSARCNASTPGAAALEGGNSPAVAAYAMKHPQTYATRTKVGRRMSEFRRNLSVNPRHRVSLLASPMTGDHSRGSQPTSVGVLVLRHQRQRCLQENVHV